MMQQLNNITPQEFCEMTKLCKPPKLTWKRNDCATCQFVILEIKLKLQDPKVQVCVLDISISQTTCLQLSSVFLAIDHSVSVSHLVAKQFLLVLCIVVWIVLQAKLLEVLLKGCNRVTNHVEEVSSAIPSLLPSICDTCKFWSVGKIFAPVSPFSILS